VTAASRPVPTSIAARRTRGAVSQKIVMAVSGLVLVAYLISHVLANLLAYAGPRWINGYGALLHATGPLLWVARLALLAAAVLHVNAAVRLARAAREARGQPYARYQRSARGASAYATRTIRWGGVLLFVYLLVHVPMFTAGALHPGFVPGDDYQNVVRGFRTPWIAALNLAAALVAGLHVYHGVRAAATSLGTPTRASHAARVVRAAALGIGVLVGVGFASLPLAVAAGLLRR
jgi:succinate dehydrogenase / fumarate reductase, cytochrome b subunit